MSAPTTGWLDVEAKKGTSTHMGKWKRRYFVLDGKILEYYRDETCTGKNHRLKLDGPDTFISNCKAARTGHWPFRINMPESASTKHVHKWVLSGMSREVTEAWVDALSRAGLRSTFQLADADPGGKRHAHGHAQDFPARGGPAPSGLGHAVPSSPRTHPAPRTGLFGRREGSGERVHTARQVPASPPARGGLAKRIARKPLRSGRRQEDDAKILRALAIGDERRAAGRLSSGEAHVDPMTSPPQLTSPESGTTRVRPLSRSINAAFSTSAPSALMNSLSSSVTAAGLSNESSLRLDTIGAVSDTLSRLKPEARERLFGLLQTDPSALERLLLATTPSASRKSSSRRLSRLSLSAETLSLQPRSPGLGPSSREGYAYSSGGGGHSNAAGKSSRGSSRASGRLMMGMMTLRHGSSAPLLSLSRDRPSLSVSADTNKGLLEEGFASASADGDGAATKIQRHARGRSSRLRTAETQSRRSSSNSSGGSSTGGERGLSGLGGGSFQLERDAAQRRYARCVVVGSLNMDLRAEAHTSWDDVGVTTVGTFSASPGGKGANEAVGVARLGVATALVGRVGRDEMGRLLLAALRSEENR